MPEYNNEMRFALFVAKPNVNPKAPTHTGGVTIDGKRWILAGWCRKDKNGNDYFSGEVKDPDKLPQI